jgi:N-acetylglucosaminyldiphosphoundecaprenol N-acetyl-beta-D-mannosaminyltransferase
MHSSSIAPTTTVADVAFSNVTMRETVNLIRLIVQKGNSPEHICTGNLDHLYQLQRDPEFRRSYETAALVLPDGMPIVWMSHLSRQSDQSPLQERVAGSDLFWELVEASASSGLRLFFLGGAPGSAEKACEVAQERFPGCHISGVYCPPYETFNTPEEQAHIERLIREAAPDVLLVGLGAPKQEKWILANKARLGVPVSVGVGGTFEMAAGVVRRAPSWMQRSGMEWVFRLSQDPNRLWRRYLCNDLPFLMRALTQVARQRAPKDRDAKSSRSSEGHTLTSITVGQERK